MHVTRRAVQTVWRFGLLPSAQRTACTGATRSASVLGRFDLLVSTQRAAGPARCAA
ncbi:hypothetical protein A2U01_0070636 [Trifolium medium]|uniref:Uncharacterized protein n=1 Tax=Trifolium medium TaxID=97028 RepID=A0A392SLU5_9FABA|nr:hypothetical protein [Trifolium medium]